MMCQQRNKSLLTFFSHLFFVYCNTSGHYGQQKESKRHHRSLWYWYWCHCAIISQPSLFVFGQFWFVFAMIKNPDHFQFIFLCDCQWVLIFFSQIIFNSFLRISPPSYKPNGLSLISKSACDTTVLLKSHRPGSQIMFMVTAIYTQYKGEIELWNAVFYSIGIYIVGVV